MSPDDVRRSKRLSLILRHNPEKVGLALDAEVAPPFQKRAHSGRAGASEWIENHAVRRDHPRQLAHQLDGLSGEVLLLARIDGYRIRARERAAPISRRVWFTECPNTVESGREK